MRRIAFYGITSVILLTSLTVFSQEKSDTICRYQPPLISCQQAQENANAIYKYPVALRSIEEKETIIKTKERELFYVKSGFAEERSVFTIDLQVQKELTSKQERAKKRWKYVSLTLGILAAGFYVKGK